MKHVLEHTKSNPYKPTHSVINVEKTKLLKLLDEAWSTKGEKLPKDAAVSFGNYGRVVGTAGIEPSPYSNAAHHIVPWNDRRAVEAQELLKEIEIHHDSASNGVFLPYKVNEYVTTEVLHIGSHSKEYIREVTERLNSVIKMGGTQADVAEVLHKIRQDLLEGKIRLNEPKK
nr:AHH domain-containing protein [Bacillus toyonensis]